MSEESGYRAVIAPDGTVRVTSPGGNPVHKLSPDQIEVLWLTFDEGTLRNRLGETSHDHNGKLFRAVKGLWETNLLVRGRSFADLDFSETGLEVAEFLFKRWSGWDLYKQKYEIV